MNVWDHRSMDPLSRLDASVHQTSKIVANTGADQLGASTPCSDWDVRALINHTIGAMQMFRDVAVKGEADLSIFGDDLVGADPVASFDGIARETLAAWREEGRMSQPANMPWGAMPADIALSMLANDVLVHGWDLATATGQQVAWDQALAEDTYAFASGFFTPEIRGNEFAPEVEVDAGADVMSRLVALEGRRP